VPNYSTYQLIKIPLTVAGTVIVKVPDDIVDVGVVVVVVVTVDWRVVS